MCSVSTKSLNAFFFVSAWKVRNRNAPVIITFGEEAARLRSVNRLNIDTIIDLRPYTLHRKSHRHGGGRPLSIAYNSWR